MTDDDIERLADQVEIRHDTEWLPQGREWRIGRKLGRTLYAVTKGNNDDRFLGMMESRELAQFVVDAVNHFYSIDPEHPCPAVMAVNDFHRGYVIPEDHGPVLTPPPQADLPVVPLDALGDHTRATDI